MSAASIKAKMESLKRKYLKFVKSDVFFKSKTKKLNFSRIRNQNHYPIRWANYNKMVAIMEYNYKRKSTIESEDNLSMFSL